MRRTITKFGQQMTEGNWREKMAVVDSANRFLSNCPINHSDSLKDGSPTLLMNKKQLGVYLKENNGKAKKPLRPVR